MESRTTRAPDGATWSDVVGGGWSPGAAVSPWRPCIPGPEGGYTSRREHAPRPAACVRRQKETEMAEHLKINGSFQNTSWDEATVEELDGGAKLTRASVTQDFTGDIEGDGAVEWLMAYRPDGTAHFVGLQRVRATIAARTGTFILETIGEFDGETASWTATVVPESGTRDLADLSGKGSFEAPMGSTAEFEMSLELGV